MITRRAVLAGLGGTAAARRPRVDAGFRPLLPFFAALRALEAGTRDRVDALQIGDSHTANDGFSGRMRELMQERFGNAGRGLLPPAIPFKYYKPDAVRVSADDWMPVGGLAADAPGPLGLAGLRQRADRAASVTMEVDRPGDLARVEVELLAQPGGGELTARFDTGLAAAIDTRARAPRAVWLRTGAADATRLALSTGGGVDLLSCRILNGRTGVTWSNLGTIGATVEFLARWNWTLVRAELDRLRPALIVLAFGTNEGFRDATDISAYAASYADAVRRLRAAAPGAALLLVGPPDGIRWSHAPGACADPSTGAAMETPPKLAMVREAQRSEAARAGVMFWDWSAAMGGRCSMAAWAAQSPPLAAADHVHLLHAGYRRTAETLFDHLMTGYGRSTSRRPSPH